MSRPGAGRAGTYANNSAAGTSHGAVVSLFRSQFMTPPLAAKVKKVALSERI